MPFRLYLQIAGGALFISENSLLCVECRCEENHIGQRYAAATDLKILQTTRNKLGIFLWLYNQFRTEKKIKKRSQLILWPRALCHINKSPLYLARLSLSELDPGYRRRQCPFHVFYSCFQGSLQVIFLSSRYFVSWHDFWSPDSVSSYEPYLSGVEATETERTPHTFHN